MSNVNLPTAPADFFKTTCNNIIPTSGITKKIVDDSSLIRYTTDAYIAHYKNAGYALPEAEEIAIEWTGLAGDIRELINIARNKGDKLARIKSMPPYAIARFLYEKETYALINLVGTDKRIKQGQNKFMLAKYQSSGDDKGIWCGGNTWKEIPDFQTDCQRYSVMVTPNECAQVFMCLYGFCNADSERKRARTIDKNLSAFANGIFDWEKKTLMSFSPEYVFLSKSPISLKDINSEPHITEPDGSDWTFDKWMDSISTDAEMKYALYALIQAVLRPYHDWQKIFFFVNHRGRNGKGTLGEVLKQIAAQWDTTRFADLGTKFQPLSLLFDTLVISDENDAGQNEAAKSESFAKALATHDAVSLEAKGKDRITAEPYLIQVHMYNSIPKMLDTTPSMQARLYMFKFEKSFVGKEKRYIKNDYLKRKDVLEWVVSYVCYHMDTLEEMPPLKSNAELVQEVKVNNNAVEAFLEEFEYDFGWNFVPVKALYQIFCMWYKGGHAGRAPKLGDKAFGRTVKQICEDRTDMMEYKKARMNSAAFNTSKMVCPALWDYRAQYHADYMAGKLPLLCEWMPDECPADVWEEKCNKPLYGVFFKNVPNDIPAKYDINKGNNKTETPKPEAYNKNNVGMNEQQKAS